MLRKLCIINYLSYVSATELIIYKYYILVYLYIFIFFREHGTCKHCAALLFSLHDFDSRHKDRSTQVGTDIICRWDKPRTESSPMQVDDINIQHNRSKPNNIKPTFLNYSPGTVKTDKDNDELLQAIYNIADENSCYKHILDPMLHNECVAPLSVKELGEKFNDTNEDNFVNYMSHEISASDVSRIEKLTVDSQ